MGQFQQRPIADYGSGPYYGLSGPGIRNPQIAVMGMGGMLMQALHTPTTSGSSTITDVDATLAAATATTDGTTPRAETTRHDRLARRK